MYHKIEIYSKIRFKIGKLCDEDYRSSFIQLTNYYLGFGKDLSLTEYIDKHCYRKYSSVHERYDNVLVFTVSILFGGALHIYCILTLFRKYKPEFSDINIIFYKIDYYI
jgi:hypothetical protein